MFQRNWSCIDTYISFLYFFPPSNIFMFLTVLFNLMVLFSLYYQRYLMLPLFFRLCFLNFSLILMGVKMWCYMVFLSGIEFQVVCWIIVLKCSIACIISLKFFRHIYVFDIIFTYLRKSLRKRSARKFILLLCSTQGCIFLTF